jgi:O-antigen ligase/tetratricopeptide (TPR) repeat protein
LVAAVAALLFTTALAAGAALLRGPPGAPYAWSELLRFSAMVGAALAAAQATADLRWRRLLFESIHAAAGVVSLIGLVQHTQIVRLGIPTISVPGATFGNRNMAAEAVALSIPFGLGLLTTVWERRNDDSVERRPGSSPRFVLIALFLALELVYLAVTRTRGAWLGGACGAAVFLLLRRPALPRPARAAALALGAAVLIAALIPGRLTPRDMLDSKRYAPGQRLVLEAFDPSAPAARTRIGLWRRTWMMYREHPMVGVGPGNFAVMFPRYAEPGATADGVLSPTVAPRRAHNDLLERLAETGPLGLGALLAVYAAAAGIARRRTRASSLTLERTGLAASASREIDDGPADATAAAAAAASLAALLGCGLTGFPLAMPATALLFGLAIGVLAALGAAPVDLEAASGRRRSTKLARAAAWAFAGVMVAGVVFLSARTLLGSYWLARAETDLRRGPAPGASASAFDSLERSERIDPGRFVVALRTAQVAVRLGRNAEALRAADRALALEPHSPNAWTARADALLHAGDPGGAAQAAQRALALLADYPGALAVAARASERLGDRAAAREARARLAALAVGSGEARRLLQGLGPPGGEGPGASSATPAEQQR